ncbi:EHD2 [Symbiodinium natans]|uniref:EHD2 protein n=1 Tax=Symbiodinium natans TaxID=878477 RepID=A0A812KW17_9DINO|nr:EHD2 [Symbiodinium natans]
MDGPRRAFRGRPYHRALLVQLACLTALAWWGSELAFGRRKVKEEPVPEPVPPPASTVPRPVMLAGCCVAGVLLLVSFGCAKTRTSMRRPYRIPDFEAGKTPTLAADAEAEFRRVVKFLQDVLLIPIDVRMPGRPFEYDMHSFPFTPMVLVIGNHSSGKSTFINKLLGKDVQDTGVAPTDDGFTILERRTVTEVEDGPTVLGCPENRPFAELQRFGQTLAGVLRRKRILLPQESQFPFGLQIVDSPGMIDLPVNEKAMSESKGRGYNFVEVVRWWAKRADLILLLFDPDKPGTTGETLQVLTKSLAGLNHKFLVILNKVDKLDNSVDFARAYGALGWALSKVIKRKDIPAIYTMFNDGMQSPTGREGLPLERFVKKREEVILEVMRVRERHNDNIITSLEETMRQMQMVVGVVHRLRYKASDRYWRLKVWAVFSAVVPAIGIYEIMHFAADSMRLAAEMAAADLAASAVDSSSRRGWGFLRRGGAPVEEPEPAGHVEEFHPFGTWVYVTVAVLYVLFLGGVLKMLWESFIQYQKELYVTLDATFDQVFYDRFIHDEGEDLRSRWSVVRPKVESILQATSFYPLLPIVTTWEMQRISEALQTDIWYLRQLARQLRQPQSPSTASPTGASSQGQS